MAGAQNTVAMTREEWIFVIDAALETAFATCLVATLPYTSGGAVTPGVRKVGRQQTLNMMVKRMVRKATQRRMRGFLHLGDVIDANRPAGSTLADGV
jgi:hypothetical protein